MAMRPSTRLQLARMGRDEPRLPGRKMEIEYERWDEPRQRYDTQTQPRSDWREPVKMSYDEPESRFRDRRGREHYDNGRYAPMAGGYGPYAAGYDDPFGRDERGGDDMRPIGFNSNWGGEMRMGSDASVPRYNEMERMPGNRAMMGGYMADRGRYPKMDERTAMEWVKSMTAADGTPMPHWTMEQVKQVAKQKGLRDMEIPELFAILNALYSDYDPIFKRHGVSKMDFYVEMAEAWLQDEDAVENKAMAYRECVVKK